MNVLPSKDACMSDAKSEFSPDSPRPGDPVWRLALCYPRQGSWTEEDYLELDALGGRLVEFDNGCVEVLEMPTLEHQRIVKFLVMLLEKYAGDGEVLFAPLPMQLWAGKFREPDVIFMRPQRGQSRGYPDGADLVIEVVSDDPKSRQRDEVIKPKEYERAGIEEYWIVDAAKESITFHRLIGDQYEAQTVGRGESCRSNVLVGLELAVNDVLAAAQR